jgi:hypothetical protein
MNAQFADVALPGRNVEAVAFRRGHFLHDYPVAEGL